MYAGIVIEFEALNKFPDNEIYDGAFIYDEKNIDDEPNVEYANDYHVNMVLSIAMSTDQELEMGAI